MATDSNASDPASTPDAEAARSLEDATVAEEFVIRNEFAYVVIRKVISRAGERMQITSPFFQTTVFLDALDLEGLSWQKPDFFSRALQGSQGPVEDEEELPPSN
jgi:hypothetical protein